jgi:hypothetical protein
MSHNRLPPPDPAGCLLHCYPSSQKGGTLIAEDVTDREAHEKRLCDPDGYRPARCPCCGHPVLHVHDYRSRILLAEPGDPEAGKSVARIVIHQCAAESCGATWRILPLFIARLLRRSWPVVEAETIGPPRKADAPPVPKRTARRWRARLRSRARQLVQVLATSGGAMLTNLAQQLGLDATRGDLVLAYATACDVRAGQRLAGPAALVHRLCPWVRLM